MRSVMLALSGCLVLAAASFAQQPRAVPVRPRLASGADTNSATAYHDLGARRLRQDPVQAAAAFYWAARLDPESATHPYARWIALVIAEPALLFAPRRGDTPRAAEARALDSLMVRALMLDPFLHRRFDDQLAVEFAVRELGGTTGGNTERYVRRLMELDPDAAALVNYSRGQFRETLDILGQQERLRPKNPYLRVERARAFFLLSALDSARIEMDSALAIARRRDADSTRFSYENKAAWEFSLGRILEQQGNVAGARAALERALIEDLAYYPAHTRLGILHAQRGDTAQALRELALAVATKDDEYTSRMAYAYFLATSARFDSAAIHLRRAVELEPWAPQPRLMLGSVQDATGNATGALEAFEAFVARAPRNDPDLLTIRTRVAALRAARP